MKKTWKIIIVIFYFYLPLLKVITFSLFCCCFIFFAFNGNLKELCLGLLEKIGSSWTLLFSAKNKSRLCQFHRIFWDRRIWMILEFWRLWKKVPIFISRIINEIGILILLRNKFKRKQPKKFSFDRLAWMIPNIEIQEKWLQSKSQLEEKDSTRRFVRF